MGDETNEKEMRKQSRKLLVTSLSIRNIPGEKNSIDK